MVTDLPITTLFSIAVALTLGGNRDSFDKDNEQLTQTSSRSSYKRSLQEKSVGGGRLSTRTPITIGEKPDFSGDGSAYRTLSPFSLYK